MVGIACEAGSCLLSQLELLAQLRMTLTSKCRPPIKLTGTNALTFILSPTHEAAGRGCHMENSARRATYP
jgi:hypothetical protein